jgi:aminoglycoside 6'-N-acetyltransferase
VPVSSDRENRIAFRPLVESDLPTMLRWLSDPGVAEWWRESDLSLESLIGKYQPIIDGNEPTRCFVIVIDGRDTGMIQCYFVADHPDYARQIGLPLGSVGTDLFFGDPGIRGKGWAVPMLAAFHRRIVFGEMGAKLAIIAPEPANLRAIHVYGRVGFRWLKTVPIKDDDPLQSGKEYVMVMTPEAFAGRDDA